MAQRTNPRHNRSKAVAKKPFKYRAFSEKAMIIFGIFIAVSMVATLFLIAGSGSSLVGEFILFGILMALGFATIIYFRRRGSSRK